jgi:hypothetical protein
MSRDRRPDTDTPAAAPRRLTDDRGRHWTGTVTSGLIGGGETYAEVIFACDDQPSETKRVSRLTEPPARATQTWESMGDDDLRAVFDRSMPA